MSDKKLKSKQKWCQNAIAILTPFIERKEHITRSTAGKLLKPVTNWQRREVDTLRKQANQIIRGDAVNPLTYSVFGMALEHPDLQAVRDTVEQTMVDGERPFLLPEHVKITGCAENEYDVFFDPDFGRRRVNVGDTWVINTPGASHPNLLFIEDALTYVVVPLSTSNIAVTGKAYRCIYPECTKIADITILGNEARPVAQTSAEILRQPPNHDAVPKSPVAGDVYKKRVNPRYTVLVADEYVSALLDEKYFYYRRTGTVGDFRGTQYVYSHSRWLRLDSLPTDSSLRHGTDILSGSHCSNARFSIMRQEEVMALAPDQLINGVAYVNDVNRLVAWVNNEWVDMGPFHHSLGYVREPDGEVRPKYRRDLLGEYLGCEPTFIAMLDDWSELPAHPCKGDMYDRVACRPADAMREVVWDGEVWCETTAPYHPIAIPEYVVEVREAEPAAADPNWTFEEPKPNPKGFWSRIGRMLGFK